MAELAIKIGDSHEPHRYRDGDVIQAFNRRRIRLVHAQAICHPRVNGRKVAGLLETKYPLLEKYYQRTAQYKWEQVSVTEVRRTNLWTSGEIVYGSTPVEDPDRPGHMIHCHVEEHFAFRLNGGRLPVFGAAGRVVEYGGRHKQDGATVELIWDDIEAATPLRRTDHDRFPAGTDDLKGHLFVSVDDFDDSEAEELMAPLTKAVAVTEENPLGIEIVAKRKHNVDWRANIAGDPAISASVADIEDRTKSVDVRSQKAFLRANIVTTKTVQAAKL